jgi:hypothetical protein
VPVETSDDPDRPEDDKRRRKFLIAGGVGAAVIIAIIAGVLIAKSGDDSSNSSALASSHSSTTEQVRSSVTEFEPTTEPEETTSTSSFPTGPPVAVTPLSVSASSTDADGTDECTPPNPVSFQPANLFDGDPSTAWRVDGNGVNTSIDVTLDGPTRLTSIGLIPGYAKHDPCSGADRFPQSYRIASVSYAFDDGTTVSQSFADSPTMQTTPVDTTTSHVVVTITGTTQPAYPVGDPSRREKTPISEIAITGVQQ